MDKSKDLDHKFLYIALLLVIPSIIAAYFIDIKVVLIILFALLILISYLLYKDKIGQELILAFIIALALTSYYRYEYTTENLAIRRINVFPLIAWTIGLVFLRELYETIKSKYKLAIICIIYIIGLFVLEYIGYYLFNIKLNSNYTSLFGIGILHAPIEIKIFYLLAGPLYIIIANYLKAKHVEK